VAPQVGLGTAGAKRERGAALPDDSLGSQDRATAREWLAILDDFRNYLIGAA